MSLINGLGKKTSLSNHFDQIFEIDPDVQLMDWNKYTQVNSTFTINVKVKPGNYYVLNPYGKAVNTITLKPQISALNTDGEILTLKSGESTVKDVQFISNYILYIGDKTLIIYLAANETLAKEKRFQRVVGSYTTDLEIDSINFALTAYHNDDYKYGITTLEHLSMSYIESKTIGASVKEVLDYWEQFQSKVRSIIFTDTVKSLMKCESIRQMNQSRTCIRVGTFNKSANVGKDNNAIIKKMFSDYGLDFVGMQEVSCNNTYGNYPEELASDTLPYVDTAENAEKSPYLDNRLLSRYPIQTVTKVTYTIPEEKETQEWRGYTKCEIQLPRYKDYYPNGDQMLSVYVTHFDPDSVCSLSEANELAEVIKADTNMFKIVLADTNDFTQNKVNWKALTDSGLKQVHDGSCKTVAADKALDNSSSIDQIFVSPNITVIEYNLVNSNNYTCLLTNGGMSRVSDHDLLYADLQLDYGLE